MHSFGKPVAVFTMILTADKKLARVNVDDVRAAIDEQGFYLQMPPAKEDYLLDVHRAQLNARDAAQCARYREFPGPCLACL